MSLISTPNGDGTRTIQVDFCYYLKTPKGRPKGQKPWQHYDKEEAERRAHKHLENFEVLSGRVEHDPTRQHYLAIYIVKGA